jgi:putative aldouronate transport system substrate-binding protein
MNSKFVLRITCLFISAVLTVSLVAGCGESDEAASSNIPLTYWCALDGNVSPNFKSLGDTPFSKELEKKTGVKLEYLHPPAGQEKEAFNMMIASGDLPDLIEYSWRMGFPGGPELAIRDNIILKLNDSINKYAPNLKKYLAEHPEIDKAVKTDSGSYYAMPFIRGDEMLLTTYGLAIRNDWLSELGLQSPTTIDEWYTVLKAFKEKKKASAPFAYAGAGGNLLAPFKNGVLIGAYGIILGFYQENGKVKFGPFEPAYQDFLATMNKWYKEGLLDKNFALADSKAVDAYILNGQTGATPMFPGSGLGKYIPALRQKNPNASMAPTTFPVLKKGDTPKFSSRTTPYDGSFSVAISKNCKNVKAAMKFLDFAYGDEGSLLYNFGIRGQSYNLVNGYPKMTDEVLNNPDKLPVGQAWAKYARGNYNGPFVQRKEYIEQYYTLPEQKDALKLWSRSNAAKYQLPPITPTPEESAQYGKIINVVNTYVEEFSLKVIMGNVSINDFDKYIAQLKKIGIEKAIAIQQAALNRYNNR